MKKQRNFLAVFLVIATILTMVACTDSETSTEAETTADIGLSSTETETQKRFFLDLTVNGESDYKIVYSKLAEDEVIQIAEDFSKTIQKYTGAKLEVCSDAKQYEHEILIGDTNRAESQQVYGTLRQKDFLIQAFDGKLVIAGETTDGLKKAIKRFNDKVLYEQGKSNATDVSLRFTSDNNYYYAFDYAMSKDFKIGETPIEEYTIIYEQGNVFAEYAAYVLRNWIRDQGGYILDVYSDYDVSKRNEILVGMTTRTNGTLEENSYAIHVQGKKLCVMFQSMIAQEKAIDELKEHFFVREPVAKLNDGFKKTVPLSEVLQGSEKSALGNEGDIRIVVNNIYQAADYYEERMKFLSIAMLEFKPDVIALQECGTVSWTKVPLNKTIHGLMSAQGYETVLGNHTTANATPLMYNTNTLELLDQGYHCYTLENNGNSKSFTWARFKVKATGKIFIAFSTHFMYNTGLSQDGIHTYDDIQVQNATELAAKMEELFAQYDCPIFGGGDINCQIGSNPYNKLITEGFTNVRDLADFQDAHTGTCSPNDTPDRETGFFFDNLGESAVKGEIDSIFAYGDAQDYHVLLHDILIHDFTVATSDHTPVLADIQLK